MNNIMIKLFHLFLKLFNHKTDGYLKLKHQCVEKAESF